MTSDSFTPDQIDELTASFAANGFATLGGLFSDTELEAAELELAHAQHQLALGVLDDQHATDILDDPDAMIDGRPFAHYVCFATQVSKQAEALAYHPVIVDAVGRLIGSGAWLLDYEQFGVVYQDARPDPGSGYSRIGWHSDHQSGPHLDIWPSVAFTVHFDPTSPANGFLRVVPGSHLSGEAGMPSAFQRIPGEVAVYQERGDVLFHHADLWHSAARGTADGDDAIRRHLRGTWHRGTRLDPGHGTDDFVKNALR